MGLIIPGEGEGESNGDRWPISSSLPPVASWVPAPAPPCKYEGTDACPGDVGGNAACVRGSGGNGRWWPVSATKVH